MIQTGNFLTQYSALFATVAIFFIAAVAWSLFRRRLRWVRKAICTPNELEFFLRVSEAAPEYLVLPQVAMGALLSPHPELTGKTWRRARNAFAQKIVDYTICDPKTLDVVVLIELDDRTHDPDKDARRDAMTRQAGYRTLRFHSKQKPSVAMLRHAIAAAAQASRGEHKNAA